MPNPLKSRPLDWLASVPIVDPKTGMLTDSAQRLFRDVIYRTDATTTGKGEIQSLAPVSGRTEGISTTVGKLDSGGVVLAAGADFTRAYLNKNLDNVPNATRAAWDTVAQKTAAVDANGNLLLKNVVSVSGSTSTPTTSSTTFVTIPEMTRTITTKGNKVISLGCGTFSVSAAAGSTFLSIAIFRDGVQISATSKLSNGAGLADVVSLFIDNQTAGTYTYDWRWMVNAGTDVGTGDLTNRVFQAVELG